MKRFSFFLLMIVLFDLSLFSNELSCPFCTPKNIERQYVHGTDEIMVLYCLTPATKGNLLIIPNRHIERFEQLTPKEFLSIQQEINLFSTVFKRLYGTSDFVILQKNGKKAGRSVAHLHFHIIPAPKPFDQIVDTAYHFREKISDEEMKIRTQELREFLASYTLNPMHSN